VGYKVVQTLFVATGSKAQVIFLERREW